MAIEDITIYRIIGYFVLYSLLGFIMETVFAIVVYGSLESRQGFLYGPFCPIYGLGAVVLILALHRFEGNGYAIFFIGMLVGSAVEYIVSLCGELIFGVRWWDYSNRFLNINGRICLLYAFYWGVISLFLMKELNPKVDRIIDKIIVWKGFEAAKAGTVALGIFLAVDCILTCFVLEAFLSRTVVENDIDTDNRAAYERVYETVYNHPRVKKLMDTVWNEHFIIKVYPNLKITQKDGSIIMARDCYPDVKPYLYKFKNKMSQSTTY